jgi:hypothetical protein
MVLKYKVTCKMNLYHKDTLEKLTIDRTVHGEYNEESEEYKLICSKYETKFGFMRDEDKTSFDEMLLTELVKQAKQTMKDSVNEIVQVIKRCYLEDEKVTAVIEFGGYIINPKQFCAVEIGEYKTNISKE